MNKAELKLKNVRHLSSNWAKKTYSLIKLNLRKYFTKRKVFEFNGKKIPYFLHAYNSAWENERTIEIPIIREYLEKNKKILEIGNVLSHYFSCKHDILDKYEIYEGVINQDAAEFKSKKKYDLIVSISTLEHIGWDEKPRDNKKIFRTIKNLTSQLERNGKIVATIPLGYNNSLDNLIKIGKINFHETYFMKRISGKNLWVQVNQINLDDISYNFPFPNANVVFIGILHN